jgi:probable HAF family extracellular repeat protein
MKHSHIIWSVILGITLATNARTCLADVPYFFTTIEVPGAVQTGPEGINDRDQVVGFDDEAFLYSGGSFTTFSYPGGHQTDAHGINNSSQIVGEFAAEGQFHGFLYSGGSFSAIDYPGAVSFTSANGINDSGQIVGRFFDGAEYHGFLDIGGSFTAITDPGAACASGIACGTFATGINGGGDIVGYYGDSTGVVHGFLYSGGNFTTIDYPGLSCPPGSGSIGCGTFVFGINNNGQIVGSVTLPVRESDGGFLITHYGFLDTGGNFIKIEHPDHPNNTFVTSVNNGGDIVGYFLGITGDPVGFLARPAFAGTPGFSNCHGQSVSALAQQFGGLNNAAAALGFVSVQALQDAIMTFCEG